MGRHKKMHRLLIDFFDLIDQYLTRHQNENGAYLVLYWLEKVAGEFKASEGVYAQNFQEYWLDRKANLKKLALTDDFQKVSTCLEKKLEQILNPDGWGMSLTARELGEIRPIIKRAMISLSTPALPE